MVGAPRSRPFNGRRLDDDERSLESQMSTQADSNKRKVASAAKNSSATQNTTQPATSSGSGQDTVATASSMTDSFDGPEGYPQIPSFHNSFRTICRSAASIITRCRTVHAQHVEESFDSLVQSCGLGIDKVEAQLQNFPDAGTIVLMGMTGKGKSSTMNSLLKQMRSAYESANTRGTFVVTYYKNALPGQKHNFVVEVVTRYSDDMNTTVERLVRGFYGPDPDAVTEDEDEDEEAEFFAATQDDRDRLQTSACKTLDDVLTGSELLRDHKDSKAYLLHMQANTTHNLHGTVIEQVAAAVGRVMDEMLGQGRDKVCRYDCATPGDVQKAMANIARTTVVNQHPVPSIWPFIEYINVYIINEFLATGLTLVDTPGLGDENLWVESNTNTAMTKAGMIVLVHDHARPDNQAVLDRAIRQCVHLGKIASTIMVLTGMDGITVPPEDDRAALSVAQLDRLQAVERAVSDHEQRFTEATRRLELLSEDDDASAADRRGARANRDATRTSLNEARRARTAYAVNIFIDKHRNLLRDKVDDPNLVARAGALKVIHISNKQYFSADPDAQVSLVDTGIPRLRGELWRFAHKDHLSHLKSVLRQLLLALFGIDAVLNHAPNVRKEAIRPNLRAQLDHEPQLSTSFFQDLFDAHVDRPMLASSASYTTAMIDVVHTFGDRFKAQSVTAFLKKDGVFKPRGSIDEIDWNVELCKVFSNDAFAWWTDLACLGTAAFKKYQEAFETHFEDVCSSMSELGVKNGFDPSAFNTVVGLRAQQLDAEIRAIWVAFIGTTDALGDSLMGYRAQTLLQQALQPAYADASKIIGGGKKKVVKAGFTASTGKNVTTDRIEYLTAYMGDASLVREGFTRTDPLYNELSAQPMLSRTVMDVLRRRTETEYLNAGATLRAKLPAVYIAASQGIMEDFEQRFGDADGKDGSALSRQALGDFMEAIADGRGLCEGELAEHMANCDRYNPQDDRGLDG